MKNKKPLQTARILAAAFCALTVTGCASQWPILKEDTAKHLALPAFMINRSIPADPFTLTAYERVRQPGSAITIYIEDEGQSKTSTVFSDPTPANPVALHIATRDLGPNVIYLARPCQYTDLSNGKSCPKEFWTTKRYAPEVLNGVNAALDDIKARYQATGFNLVGYAGGGTVAVLLGGLRSDVASIRTIAGDLDTGSVSADAATKTAKIPQLHFIGIYDETTTPELFDGYKAAGGSSACVKSHMTENADHIQGWVTQWPDLVSLPVDCVPQVQQP